jgi:hypothetical protein
MLKGIELRKIWILTQSQRKFKDFVVSSFSFSGIEFYRTYICRKDIFVEGCT